MGKLKSSNHFILFLFIYSTMFLIFGPLNSNAQTLSLTQAKIEEAKRAVRLRDYALAVESYSYLAERGDADSQYQMGVFYLNGQGVEKNYVKAVRYFKKAAEKSHAKAEFNLASIFENGWGIKQDYQNAILWYKRSADHGYPQALLRLKEIESEKSDELSPQVSLPAAPKNDSDQLPVDTTKKEDVAQKELPVVAKSLEKLKSINPERGIGFAFGIFGTALMVILFIYTLKKRLSGLGLIGSLKTWFRMHMVLGILGPVLILLHCNFRLGSPNSRVALYSMLIVAVSGVIGRFFYAKTHYGLYGKMANLTELKNALQQQKEEAELEFSIIPGVKDELFPFADYVLTPSTLLINSIKRFLVIRWRALKTYWKINSMVSVYINECARKNNWEFTKRLRMQIQTTKKISHFMGQAIRVAEFNLYERIFSFWHFLHIPLVFILFFTVILHVTAANRY